MSDAKGLTTLANGRPTSLDDDLYQWGLDAESALRNAASEIERLKTVPMKYRRLAFNAELQNEVALLERKVAQLEAANKEWHDKTEWLRKDLQPHELGKHLADVLRERLERRSVERDMVQRDAVNLARVDITDDRSTL